MFIFLILIFAGQGIFISKKIEKIQSMNLSVKNEDNNALNQSSIEQFKTQYKQRIYRSSSLNKNWSRLLTSLPEDVVIDSVTMMSLNEVKIQGRAFYKDSIYAYLDALKSVFSEQRIDNLSTLDVDNLLLHTFSLYLVREGDVY